MKKNLSNTLDTMGHENHIRFIIVYQWFYVFQHFLKSMMNWDMKFDLLAIFSLIRKMNGLDSDLVKFQKIDIMVWGLLTFLYWLNHGLDKTLGHWVVFSIILEWIVVVSQEELKRRKQKKLGRHHEARSIEPDDRIDRMWGTRSIGSSVRSINPREFSRLRLCELFSFEPKFPNLSLICVIF